VRNPAPIWRPPFAGSARRPKQPNRPSVQQQDNCHPSTRSLGLHLPGGNNNGRNSPLDTVRIRTVANHTEIPRRDLLRITIHSYAKRPRPSRKEHTGAGTWRGASNPPGQHRRATSPLNRQGCRRRILLNRNPRLFSRNHLSTSASTTAESTPRRATRKPSPLPSPQPARSRYATGKPPTASRRPARTRRLHLPIRTNPVPAGRDLLGHQRLR